jgi:predicted Fe-S protein YdhL (DUF1289 family)
MHIDGSQQAVSRIMATITSRIFRGIVKNMQLEHSGLQQEQALCGSADDASPDYRASPCINVCVMNAASGLCDGCLRTLDEIAAWSCASDEQKRGIWQHIQRRRAAA